MNVLSNKLFSSNPATYKNIASLTQQPRSLYSVGAAATTRIAMLPLSSCCRRVTGRQKLSKINSMVKDMMGCHGATHGPKTDEERFKILIKAKEKTAKYHVYVQDALGGLNPTVWEVAKSDQTANSPTAFGDVRVVDDLLTTGPDPRSEKLGRTQGTITYSDLSETALTMNLTFYFTGGEYKGNSISIGGRNPISNKDREMPIIGGTGVFRMARGYVISNTHSYDAATNYGVLEYTFYVAYPDQEEI